MILEPRMVRAIAGEVGQASAGVITDYSEGLVTDEPQITDRLLGAISDRLRERTANGITWRVKTLRPSHGSANEEQRHGADFLGVLDVAVPGLKVKKGFLAQAKRAEPGVPMSKGEWNRMAGQCRTMLEVTPDAFVAVYSRSKGVRLIPAVEIAVATNGDLFDHYSRSIGRFFELFIECFIGDRQLHSAKIELLDEIRSAVPVLELTVAGD